MRKKKKISMHFTLPSVPSKQLYNQSAFIVLVMHLFWFLMRHRIMLYNHFVQGFKDYDLKLSFWFYVYAVANLSDNVQETYMLNCLTFLW